MQGRRWRARTCFLPEGPSTAGHSPVPRQGQGSGRQSEDQGFPVKPRPVGLRTLHSISSERGGERGQGSLGLEGRAAFCCQLLASWGPRGGLASPLWSSCSPAAQRGVGGRGRGRRGREAGRGGGGAGEERGGGRERRGAGRGEREDGGGGTLKKRRLTLPWAEGEGGVGGEGGGSGEEWGCGGEGKMGRRRGRGSWRQRRLTPALSLRGVHPTGSTERHFFQNCS